MLSGSCFRTAVAILVAGLAGQASAEHTTFGFDVERFEFSEGGATVFVDEFDDGFLDTVWNPTFGTSVEVGDVLRLRDPGTDRPLLLPDGTIFLDRSDVLLTGAVIDPSDDFAASSTWSQAVPDVNDFFGLMFYYQSAPNVISYHAVAITNPDPVTASRSGMPPGPHVVFLRKGTQPYDSVPFDSVAYTEWELDAIPIGTGDVIGDLVLRLAFDADASEFTGSASLDGGQSFVSFAPEPAGAIFAPPAGFGLIADPIASLAVPGPGPIAGLLLLFALMLSARFGSLRRRRDPTGP